MILEIINDMETFKKSQTENHSVLLDQTWRFQRKKLSNWVSDVHEMSMLTFQQLK